MRGDEEIGYTPKYRTGDTLYTHSWSHRYGLFVPRGQGEIDPSCHLCQTSQEVRQIPRHVLARDDWQ